MTNPSKAKGTRFETEVVKTGLDYGLDITRTSPGLNHDIRVKGSTGRMIQALVTRPDHGRALVTIPLRDFFHLLQEHGDNAQIECKRYKTFAHHTIFEDKFPRG